jgi:hypothetical protein
MPEKKYNMLRRKRNKRGNWRFIDFIAKTRERKKMRENRSSLNDNHLSLNVFYEGCSLLLAAEFFPNIISQAIIPYKSQLNSIKANHVFNAISSKCTF